MPAERPVRKAHMVMDIGRGQRGSDRAAEDLSRLVHGHTCSTTPWLSRNSAEQGAVRSPCAPTLLTLTAVARTNHLIRPLVQK